jgi:hypothetical protein
VAVIFVLGRTLVLFVALGVVFLCYLLLDTRIPTVRGDIVLVWCIAVCMSRLTREVPG